MNHTYIVTGATGGIGTALTRAIISHEIAENNSKDQPCHLIVACRNEAKSCQLISELYSRNIKDYKDSIKVEYMHLDLESFASVNAFAQEIGQRGIRITTLFNNAGTMPAKMRLTVDGYESASQVNYLATRMLTDKLLPYIENGGSIVFTTSLTRHITRLHQNWEERSRLHHNRFVTYGRSKRMITAYAEKLARQLAPRRIRVNCSDPLATDTDMITLGIPWLDRLSDHIFRPFIQNSAQAAENALKAALSPMTGKIFR